MKKVLLYFMTTVLMVGCTEDKTEIEARDNQVLTNNVMHLCTTIQTSESEINQSGRVSYKSRYWAPGQTIKIKFLNGDAFLQNKVKQFANQWTLYANLKFVWVASNQTADIKVGFKWNGDKGSWSNVGVGNLLVAQNTASVNFGWFDSNTTDEEFSRVVLHEFGHSLALGHEHQNPLSPIVWNKTAVYAEYAKIGWDKITIDANILNKFLPAYSDYTPFDEKSIMLYSFPSRLTLNGYTFPWNTVLSNEDKASIAKLYPFTVIKSTLVANESLKSGKSLMSDNKRYLLVMQGDGNLVIYDQANGKLLPIWASQTFGKAGGAALLQANGNFIIYQNGYIIWHTGTAGKSGASLKLQDDGNLVMSLNGKVVWSSKAGKF